MAVLFRKSLWKIGEFFWRCGWIFGFLEVWFFFESEYWIIDQWLVIRMHTTSCNKIYVLLFYKYVHTSYVHKSVYKLEDNDLKWMTDLDPVSPVPFRKATTQNSSWMTGDSEIRVGFLTPGVTSVLDFQDCWSSHNSSRSRCLLLWLWWALYQTSRHHSQVAQCGVSGVGQNNWAGCFVASRYRLQPWIVKIILSRHFWDAFYSEFCLCLLNHSIFWIILSFSHPQHFGGLCICVRY